MAMQLLLHLMKSYYVASQCLFRSQCCNGIYISQLVRFDRCCRSTFKIPFLKSSNQFKTIDPGFQISRDSENVWKVL